MNIWLPFTQRRRYKAHMRDVLELAELEARMWTTMREQIVHGEDPVAFANAQGSIHPYNYNASVQTRYISQPSRAGISGPYTLPLATWNKISLDTSSWGSDIAFDTTNHQFNIVNAGIYLFTAYIAITNGSGGNMDIAVGDWYNGALDLEYGELTVISNGELYAQSFSGMEQFGANSTWGLAAFQNVVNGGSLRNAFASIMQVA